MLMGKDLRGNNFEIFYEDLVLLYYILIGEFNAPWVNMGCMFDCAMSMIECMF